MKLSSEDFRHLFRSMKFLEAKENTDIIRHNQEGDLFYIIIDGVCEVLIPDPDRRSDVTEKMKEIDNRIEI